jgi:saccharopine dehydrogenase (NAD+, L-lysine-forming)
MEVLDALGIRKVSPVAFLEKEFNQPVYTPLQSRDYHFHKDDLPWDNEDFHLHPDHYLSSFHKFTQVAHMLVATAYWHPRAPLLFSLQDMQQADFNIKTIADITCDIGGSIPCTLKPTSIKDPVYDYHPQTEAVYPPFSGKDHISIMAIDNLPSEVPYDASEYFGRQFIEQILPHFFNGDERGILGEATIAARGHLTQKFTYLQPWVSQNPDKDAP